MPELKSDWVEIMEALVENPNASLQEISERTDIPKSTVWYAKNRLREEGLLNIITFPQIDEIDGLKIGLIGGAINGEKSEVLQNVADHPNVWFLVDTIGPHSFTAGIVGRSPEEFQSVIQDLNEFGAKGDHYGDVIHIHEFGLEQDFVRKLGDMSEIQEESE